jgi:hypothetical protein
VAQTFKETDVNTGEETKQPIDENEQKEESRSLENPRTAVNPETAKKKNNFTRH